MHVSHPPSAGPSLEIIELGLTLITVALAFCCPRAGSGLFSRLERLLGNLAHKRALSVFVSGATACTLRLVLLPLSPIPHPYVHDDFSFLLAADTFAHGRLTNPTPAMWTHFESFHITLKPTYMSMYFPAQGMVMAAGKILAGHPWWGVWATCGLMCAAICWMLQGWLPPGWALLGAMLAVLRLSLFSYWMNTYTGAGALVALGGALVLGAVPRIHRHFRTRDFFWMALGMAILATSRPYEGLLVSLPAVAALAWFSNTPRGGTRSLSIGPRADLWGRLSNLRPTGSRRRPTPSVLLRRTAPAALVLISTAVFMGYYDYRVYGSVLTPPYKINRETYASVPHFLWQPVRPEPVYRHAILRDFYSRPEADSEMKWYRDETRSAVGFLEANGIKLLQGVIFYFNFALIPPLVMLPRAIRDRRIGFLTVTGTIFLCGLAVETFYLQHYLAPATAILYAVLLQCMRHLRVRGPSGLFLVRAVPVLCMALAVLRIFAQPLHIDLGSEGSTAVSWSGTAPLGLERAHVLTKLESLPGPQLAIVPYSPHHVLNDWVYNGADIDTSRVVWARQMDPASDRELLNYYKNRKAWLVEPDLSPPKISPFPVNPDPSDVLGAAADRLIMEPYLASRYRVLKSMDGVDILEPAKRNKNGREAAATSAQEAQVNE